MWARALETAHGRLRDTLQRDRHDHVVNLFERFETEIAPLLAPIIDEIVDSGALPESFGPLFDQLRDPSHYSMGIVLGMVIGATIYPVFGSALGPVTQKVANVAWSVDPDLPLSPAEVAL